MIFYFSRFRVSLILIYSVPFLLSSSLGAGSGKRMQELLGAHQERISITMKENTAVSIYRPNYKPFIVSCVRKFDIMGLFHQLQHFIICVVHSYDSFTRYFAQRNKKNLAPNQRTIFCLQNKENSTMEYRLHVHQI